VERLRQRPVLDVSGLPTVVFGPANIIWLGNLFYMLIEGTMFALLIASYFYLRTRVDEWPPGVHPPYLWFGVINGILLIISFFPAWWVQRQAPTGDLSKVRLGLTVMVVFGVVCMVLRGYEFTALNVGWNSNAYGSIVWTLIGLHTAHLITEWVETVALLAVTFSPKMEGRKFADIGVNSDYWYFVVITAVLIDFVIYGTTRLL